MKQMLKSSLLHSVKQTVEYAHKLHHRLLDLPTDNPTVESCLPLSDDLAASLTPVFVLSTGRCGTKWLTEALTKSTRVFVNHSLAPELVRQSRRAYETRMNGTGEWTEMIRGTRDDLLSGANVSQKTYVETNNRITFFANAIVAAYPQAKFIHLYRHPGDFVRSGMRRGWYDGHPHDIGRIVMKDSEQWQKLSRLERIAWLWNETNGFINDFFRDLDPSQRLSVKSERMFKDVSTAMDVCRFVGATDVLPDNIQKMTKKPINKQVGGDFPKYRDWTPAQKKQLSRLCPLASHYDYALEG